ncbi:hypothetical protein ACNSOP_09045 [Aliarcobacter lanthieri]|uniref:hypothetical protein n=1 Tax=Aliarcobacter lanthieri TaxID=1355374 RepID=UPI003AACB9F1
MSSPVRVTRCSLDVEKGWYYPFSDKFFEFIRSIHMDLMRLDDKNIMIIQEIRKDWKNILKYEFEIEQYTGEVPDGFLKDGCFILGFEDFALVCYINITELHNKTCIVFDVIQYID